MPSPQAPSSEFPSQSYFFPSDSTIQEVDLESYPWMAVTIIEDDDLTFGGKSLSTWYEEERRRQSTGSCDEEERRGRTRERPRSHNDSHQHKHHHHTHKSGKNAK